MPANEERELFPIPKSGSTTIPSITSRPLAMGLNTTTFEVRCSGVDTSDYHILLGFFNRMGGRFGEFRFEYRDMTYQKCRFDRDSVDFISHGPNLHSVTFPIKVLPV